MTLEDAQYETPLTEGDVEQFFLDHLMTPITVDDVALHFFISKEQAVKVMANFRNKHPSDCFWSDKTFPPGLYVRPSIKKDPEDQAIRDNRERKKEWLKKRRNERRNPI